jgi:DinB superfamily
MPKLHDAVYRSAIQGRIRTLRPDSQRVWGKMSVGQMLWHVNEAMEAALGLVRLPPAKTPLPRPLMKLIVINLPWPRGAPTLPSWVAGKEYDFAAERERCLRLIDDLAAKRIDDEWPSSPTLGRMSGMDVTRLHAKHLNHHLKQFGV